MSPQKILKAEVLPSHNNNNNSNDDDDDRHGTIPQPVSDRSHCNNNNSNNNNNNERETTTTITTTINEIVETENDGTGVGERSTATKTTPIEKDPETLRYELQQQSESSESSLSEDETSSVREVEDDSEDDDDGDDDDDDNDNDDDDSDDDDDDDGDDDDDDESISESSETEPSEKKNNKNSNNNNANGCEYSSLVVSVESLPPLPKPRHDILRAETRGGLVVVITAVLLSVVLTHYIALTVVLPQEFDGNGIDNDIDINIDIDIDINTNGIDIDDDEPSARIGTTIFLALVYIESALALACLFGVLCIDPCVVHRSQETCNPLPLVVESWITSKTTTTTTTTTTSTRPQQHYILGTDQRLYCTKCLVWRTKGIPHYHCSICQRCCFYHDHHCNVLGRCIAGNPRLLLFWKKNNNNNHHHQQACCFGNLLCFYGLLATGGLGFFTVFSSFVYALSKKYGTKLGIPVGLLAVLLVWCCCLGRTPINAICLPVCRLARCAKRFVRRRLRH